MNRGTLLLIAYHFPPDNAIGGARPFRFYKYLKRLGYECHVLTAARQTAGGASDVEYVPDPLRTNPRQGWSWQAERIGWKFLLRAELVFGWSEAAWQAGKAFLDGKKGERVTILSSAPPVGTHLAAWRLARYSGQPWIADFRDPIHNRTGESAMLQGIIGPRLEHRILKTADLVLANTDAMREAWSGRHPDAARNMHVLWNGFDPEDEIRPYSLPRRERKILSHVGELYGGRDIRPIIHAAGRLIDNGRLRAGDIQIRQIGTATESDLPEQSILERGQAEGWIELRPPVPAAEARALALDSDGLLLIQPHTAVQVPGKLFEYLRMGRPVFAYVVPGSPVERILERSGVPYECIYPEHPAEEVETRMLRFHDKLDRNLPAAPNAWFEETFGASRQTETLDRLIRTLEPEPA